MSEQKEHPMSESAEQAANTLHRDFHKSAAQVGAVVRDLDASIKVLSEVFGLGPFRVVDCPPESRKDRQFLRGEPARFRTRQAFVNVGPFELELIQPIEGTTIWSEFLEKHGPGLHHVRFDVPDPKATAAQLKEQGIATTQEGAGLRDGYYWINFDTEDLLGFTMEITNTAPYPVSESDTQKGTRNE
jgi:methylmalonyl-CoA/ethylmalonyl-CoA epimerase